jgi:hypothetical protein
MKKPLLPEITLPTLLQACRAARCSYLEAHAQIPAVRETFQLCEHQPPKHMPPHALPGSVAAILQPDHRHASNCHRTLTL